jgi:hypothetical protein
VANYHEVEGSIPPPLPIPRACPIQSPRLLADRQLGFRGILNRPGVPAVGVKFFVLMSYGCVDTIPQPHLRPDTVAFLAFQKIRIQDAGVHDRTCRVGTPLAPVPIE